MQNTRYELLNKLQAELGDAVTITDETDFYAVSINLGTGFAGNYKGGYWGDVAIKNDELTLAFIYGDIYDNGEESFGEGIVELEYADDSGLAYTGELDKLVEQTVEGLTGGLITCSGSEQGMQGDDYLSVDVEEAA
tara:strand:+ start:971 stop:1378 length:408 start_codon:yes stop_codon:yes gene_type:complete